MDLKDTYNRIAEDWHEDHKKDDWWIEGTDAFVALFDPGAEILDVGCAGGFKSRYLTEKGLRVTGIDLSDRLIEIAKQEVPEATFQVMDMFDVADLPHEFDGVFAQASLLHIPKERVREILEKLTSRLKRDGYLYVAVKRVRPGAPEEETKEEDDYGYTYERFFSYFTPEELKAHFGELGLETIYDTTTTVGNTNWIQMIGKRPG